MGYSNSALVSCVVKSPNHSGPRPHKIDRITPHCIVGQLSAETIGACFTSPARKASCNYGIGLDGRVALIVDEANQSWCTSSGANDQRAITIECACDMTEPYTFNTVVYHRLIELCVDICNRNGLKKVLWFGDKDTSLNYVPKDGECVLTVHRWFANKSCPGRWMFERMAEFAAAVNTGLKNSASASASSANTVTKFPAVPFNVDVLINDLNYRTMPSMEGAVRGQTGKGRFTIIEVQNGWGRLKSGAGWIWLENPAYLTVHGSSVPTQTNPGVGASNATVAVTGAPSTGSAADEKKIWDYLLAKLGNEFGVAGIMGNIYAESELKSNNLQNSFEKKLGYTDTTYTTAVDNGSYKNFVHDSAGYGLVQWTFWSLKEALYNFAASKKKSICDLDMQLEFLCKELSEEFAGVWNSCKAAKSVAEASNAMLLGFERPADQSAAVQAKRTAFGTTYYRKYAVKTTTAVTTTDVKMGHASLSENGTVVGTAGDQTRAEVCVISWYNKPWDFMAIHPDATVREKHAAAVEQACANENIGYSQYGTDGRNSLYEKAKAVNFDLTKVGKCNCDCSSLQNVAALISGATGVTYGSNAWTTSTMKNALSAAGYKIITTSAYLSSADYCVRGAIYVKAGSHTVCGLSNGAKFADTLNLAGTTASSTFVPNMSYVGKGIGTATAKVAMNVRSGAGINYPSYGEIAKGTKVEVLEVGGWFKIVWAGASCGYAYTSNLSKDYYSYIPNQAPEKDTAVTVKSTSESAAKCDASLAGTYKTTANLNIRSGAGTNKAVMTTIPKGTAVKNYGYYTEVSGVKWLCVQFTYNGTVYTGFASGKYLTK